MQAFSGFIRIHALELPFQFLRALSFKSANIWQITTSGFAKHFDKDGDPSETLIKAKQERLDNWHTLQELAGII